MSDARLAATRCVPVDSEHSAVFQCIEGHPSANVRRVILTASGGAFRDWPAEHLSRATPADALKHPNWSMGPKVTVDSATLANKGLELIEARWLFGLRPEQCNALLHPQSIVHCLVEFTDGAMLGQLSPALDDLSRSSTPCSTPTGPTGSNAPLDLTRLMSLEFRPVDEGRYPMLRFAREALAAGGVAPAVFNAANEIAVEAFLRGRIPFLAIPKIVGHTLDRTTNFEPSDLGAVLAVDTEVRRSAAHDLDIFN